MNFKRLLGAENGWGGAAGTLLLLGFGLVILFISVAGLSEASRLAPVERGCTEWLADPSGPRWVTLVGCRLDLSQGKPGLVPIFTGEAPVEPPRAVLATSDPELAAEPKTLTGYVELTGERAVLQQGKQPPRANVLLGLVVGLIAVALVVRSMFMRYLVERDSTL